MKSIPVVEAKATFSGLLAEVEAGEEVAVEVDLVAPEDKPAEDVASLDD